MSLTDKKRTSSQNYKTIKNIYETLCQIMVLWEASCLCHKAWNTNLLTLHSIKIPVPKVFITYQWLFTLIFRPGLWWFLQNLVLTAVDRVIRRKFLPVRGVRPWHRLLREAVDAPSLEICKSRMDGALSKLGQWRYPCPRQVGGTGWFWRSAPTQTIL